MKKTMCHIAVMVMLVPCLLLFNDSEYMWPNMAGLLYVVALYMSVKYTRCGRRLFLRIYRNMK